MFLGQCLADCSTRVFTVVAIGTWKFLPYYQINAHFFAGCSRLCGIRNVDVLKRSPAL